jgi:hypothetical protein
MDLTFSDRSTKVLSLFAAAPTALDWSRGTIDYKPSSSRSVALKKRLLLSSKLLFRKAFASFARTAHAIVVYGVVSHFGLAAPRLSQACRMVHRRKTGEFRHWRPLFGADDPPDRVDLGRPRRVTRSGKKDVHFHRGAQRRYKLGRNIYSSAPEVAAVAVASVNPARIVLPREHDRQPQRVSQSRSALCNWAHRCWSHYHCMPPASAGVEYVR